jgi:predicted lipoprotein
MADCRSAEELLGAGIDALAHVDAAQLEGLAEAARGARGPKTAEEWRKVRERLRTLQLLIAMTRRNLRLLRGAGCGGYGPSGV